MSDEHTSFIKTPRQLAIVVALAFIVPIVLIVLLSQLMTGSRHTQSAKESQALVLARIKPVGEVIMASQVPAAVPVVAAATPTSGKSAGGQPDGKKTYETICMACHGAGIAGAPKYGDKGAWASRIAEGANVLYQHAIAGYQGKSGVMPAKGGNPALADADVKAAVDYMTAAAK